MADDSDKTEEPTEHKLQEARKKGQIFKSQDIVSTLVLIATAGVLYALGSWMCRSLGDFTRHLFGLIPDYDFSQRNTFYDAIYVLWNFMKVLLPLLLAGFVMAIVANIGQIKMIFSTEPLKPTASKISVIEGFKRIFSMKSLMELAKQVVKLVIIGFICYKVVAANLMSLRLGVLWELPQTLHLLHSIVVKIIFQVIVAMAVIAIVDYLFQKKQYLKQMKMSFQELKDEFKDTEGNPQVKGKIRQLMRQGAMSRMMEEVPNSTAVLTNPTHLAVALKYDQAGGGAPVVVAKGARLMAMQIKLVAEDHEVPILENVELARALYNGCEIGDSIPAELYKAVAEVLAYIYKLKRKRELLRRRRQKAKPLYRTA